MKKVAMIEYQGRCDTKEKAVGHAPKVLQEYYEFICEHTEVSIYAPNVILQELPERMRENSMVLPGKIVMKTDSSFFEKIMNKLHMFQNISKALKNSDAEIVWFFNVEYYLMLYLAMHRKSKKKIVCTLFQEKFSGSGIVAKVKQKIFSAAQKKINLIITTGEKFCFPNCEYKFIPDYYYSQDKYEKYLNMTKRERVVCLGTMGNGKQLEELVETFNFLKYPLVIAGRFYDKERFQRLKETANENIVIEDKYLSEEEYMETLASAKYAILPYDESQYQKQTSGVLQEAIFVNTIPVTYEKILSGNNLSGIGFSSWSDLKDNKGNYFDEDVQNTTKQCEILELLCEYEKLRNGIYSRANIEKEYADIFSNDFA